MLDGLKYEMKESMNNQKIFEKLEINTEIDLVKIRQAVRKISRGMQFDIVAQTKLITAVSELTRNVFLYAERGEIIIEEIENAHKRGLKIKVIDEGPGIPDINLAMTDGYSTTNRFGKGLSGTKKIMDEFSIQSKVGKGTEVFIVKWVNSK